MSTWRVFDAGLRPVVTLVRLSDDTPQVLWSGHPDHCPAEPVDGEVHRFPAAPDGCPELLPAAGVDARLLRSAGRFEPRDTAARIATIVLAASGDDLPRWLVFDTPFFADLPATARHYAVPPTLAAEFGLRRRGRHGPVHRLCARPGRCVSVVLSGEVSVAALLDGRPLEVSCGLSGLEGSPGETSVGDIDPAAVLYLVETLGLSLEQVEAALADEGGLAGIADPADPDFAPRFLIHRLRRQIGAMAGVLDGLDGLVFSGVDAEIAKRVGEGLAHLGVGTRVRPEHSGLTPATAAAIVAHTGP